MSEPIENIFERPLDASWPSPLPTDTQLRDVFFNELSRSSRHTPENHLDRVRRLVFDGKTFTNITGDLHRLLSVQTEFNRSGLSGRDVMRSGPETAPLIKHAGIDHQLDVRKQVLPAVRPLLAGVMAANDGAQEKLNTVALSMGIIIGESQSLPDANTRVARAVHDYIKDGLDDLEVSRVSDVERNFSVPNSIETLVMMQNLTQLIEHPDEPTLEGDVMMVSDRAKDRYLDSAADIRSIWRIDDNDTFDSRAVIGERIKVYLSGDDEELTGRAKAVLLQKNYAPAVLAAAFGGRRFNGPLSAEAMYRLVETNLDLMRMRALSLGAGMARKGMFMTVEMSEETAAPSIASRYWLPGDM